MEVFMDFLVILGCETHFKNELRRNRLAVFRENGCRSQLACCLSQQALVTSFLVISTSVTMNDPELPK